MTERFRCRWVVRADRRSVDLERLHREILELGATLTGLDVELLPRSAFDDPRDEGAYRDWAPVAVALADDARILEALAEELIQDFGFQIDMYVPERVG